MPLEPENECECGQWKGEDFDFCKDCADAPVLVNYSKRTGETERAVLFKLEGGFSGKSVWVPKSQLNDVDELASTFCVPRWWAEQESLDYEA